MKIFENPGVSVRSRHGRYQIATSGNIIAVSAEGIASRTDIARYSNDIAEIVAGFCSRPWAFLGYLHGSAMLTEEGELELQKSVAWRAQRGMALGALITKETTVKAIVKNQFQRIYDNVGVPLGVFCDEKSALDWLAEQGFVPTP